MAASFQATVSNAFAWMKTYAFCYALVFIKVFPKGSNEQYSSIGLDNGLSPTRRQAIVWTNDS